MNHRDSIDILSKSYVRGDMLHSSGLRGYPEIMQQLGIDPLPLLLKQGLQLSELQDDTKWISQRALIQLLEDSAQQGNCADLGLRLSTYQDITILGVLGMILQSATSLREVIKYSSDLLFLHGSALRLYMNEHVTTDLIERSQDMVEIVYDIQLSDASNMINKRQAMDLGLAVCHSVLRYLFAENYQLLKVTLPHSPIASRNVYKRFFNAEIVPDQKYAALYLHKNMLNVQLNGADQGLREIVDGYLERSFRNHKDSIVNRVRHAIRIHLSSPKANKSEIAQMLAMHPRSLQRKLSNAGTSFEMIKDELRKQLLLQYLVDSRVSLSQIAVVLGFSEQSALSRACKNWFGMTPRELKAKAMSGQQFDGLRS